MGIKLIRGNGEDGGYVLQNNIRISLRELQILLFLARGQEQKEIAEHFGISINTVRNHIYNAMVKLGAINKPQAVIKAIENGMFIVSDNKDLVGWSPKDFLWCWKCGKVFTFDEIAQRKNEPVEINHVWIDVPPSN
ncbi:MAG: response regulator transcription factor, partial [Eubacteriales bacterium]